MDVDDDAQASAFSSSVDSFGLESPCSTPSRSESAESRRSLDDDVCEDCCEYPPPPPAAAALNECSSKGNLASPSRNMLFHPIVSPDRSQMYLCMPRGEECITWPDAHDDYQGLEPFPDCRMSSLFQPPFPNISSHRLRSFEEV
jgi:hypothetical protein